MLRKPSSIFLLSVLFSAASIHLKAQIYAPTANYSDTVEYSSTPHQDSIFIFNIDNEEVYIEANAGTDTLWNYQWAVYDSLTGYQDLVSINDTVSILDTITVSNGYRVIQSNGTAPADTFRCWVMINDFELELRERGSRNCDVLSLEVLVTKNKQHYFNPDSLKKIDFLFTYPKPDSDAWFAQGEESPASPKPPSSIPPNNDSTITFYGEVTQQHYYEAWYGVEVRDMAGLSKRDSMLFESITPKVEFTAEPIALTNPLYYPERTQSDIYKKSYDGVDDSAPLLVLFKNTSINADSCIWNFGDSLSGNSSGNDSILYTYKLPGTYSPSVTVYKFVDFLPESAIGCSATDKDKDIEVTPRKIMLSEAIIIGKANFRFIDDRSITDFEIKIYNRVGRKLHEFQGNIRDWDGWDGSYNGGSNYVPTGVYYWVVKEIKGLPNFDPLEENEFPGELGGSKGVNGPANNIYRGFFHVFNEE